MMVWVDVYSVGDCVAVRYLSQRCGACALLSTKTTQVDEVHEISRGLACVQSSGVCVSVSRLSKDVEFRKKTQRLRESLKIIASPQKNSYILLGIM
jgi:hypothetical protein